MSQILITDVLDELRVENKRLLEENKSISSLLQKYRQILLNFHTICVCNQKSNLDFSVKSVEKEYKTYTESQTSRLVIVEPKPTLKKRSEKYQRITINKRQKTEQNETTVENNTNSEIKQEFEDAIVSQKLFQQSKQIQKKFVCDYVGCGMRFSCSRYVKEHISSKHMSEKRFQCEECEESFVTRYELMRHNSIHLSDDKLLCKTCNKKFATTEGLSQHNRNFHSKSTSLYDCVLCDFQTRHRNGLKQHMLLMHSNEMEKKQFVCPFDECGKRFTTYGYLRIHSIQIHDLKYKSLECEECHKRFANEYQLRNHSLVHTNEAPLQCGYCDFKTKRMHTLRTHTKRLHEHTGPALECDFPDCGKTFRDSTLLKAHQTRYHRERDFVCDWPGCDMSFKLKDGYLSHRQVHLEEREFVCDHESCGKSFKTRKTLNAHKQSHIKKYECSWPECGERFTFKNLLQAHMNKHENVRPFDCYVDDCEKNFLTKTQLDQHIRSVHKHKPDPTKYKGYS